MQIKTKTNMGSTLSLGVNCGGQLRVLVGDAEGDVGVLWGIDVFTSNVNKRLSRLAHSAPSPQFQADGALKAHLGGVQVTDRERCLMEKTGRRPPPSIF